MHILLLTLRIVCFHLSSKQTVRSSFTNRLCFYNILQKEIIGECLYIHLPLCILQKTQAHIHTPENAGYIWRTYERRECVAGR
ncbi:hypothetical protein J3E72DRAFT_327248 [Bipolaris maydis]|uniref:uncharacterized protein n=1 Tax=Cochliobolus heterostrophus TaxID=5016 RepID=UPI0024D1C778|nr:hypothetical protein J3E73DRAFT_319526 [Bipolaris maydis]KAJ5064252.1 hypothetical protein J3E74DRAFT_311057 [Bipolaris maydis]KAJ6196601.1 hypothetical protein J3E72DRAFT_327248 [Bipolaris maydis]KAJ6207486.1 hypothetical protein PSV09DRAFT_2322271 [Bipolaris maydis]KAJ6269858.1 hypothetical protein PSV08DRAFT_310464 [Bipolaris maydis]